MSYQNYLHSSAEELNSLLNTHSQKVASNHRKQVLRGCIDQIPQVHASDYTGTYRPRRGFQRLRIIYTPVGGKV